MTQEPITPVPGPEHWRKRTKEVALEKGLDPYRFSRLIGWESGFNPVAGPGGAGEIGLGQFTPEWIKPGETDWRYDPEISLQRSAQYILDHYSQFGNWRQAYAAYAYGATGFQTNVLDIYGEDWEQNIDAAQRRKLEYIFGGAAVERALTPIAQAPIPGISPAAQRAIDVSRRRPTVPGFEDVPEFFTGYRKILYDAITRAEKMRQATQETEVQYNRQQQRYLQPLANDEIRDYLKTHGYTEEQIHIFFVPPMPGEEGAGIRAELGVPTRQKILAEVREFRRYQIEAMTNFHRMAIDEFKRADTLSTIVQWLPWAMVNGDVSTVADVEKFFTDFNPQGPPDSSVDPAMSRIPFKLSQEDREFVSDLMARLSPVLDIAPDVDVDVVVKALTDESWQTPKVMAAMTQEELRKYFFAVGEPMEPPFIPELGRNLTESELRGVLASFPTDDPEREEVINTTRGVARRLVEDWYNRDMTFRAYRAGIMVPEIPKLSALAKLNMLWQQPALAGAEIANLFREKWSMPIAGMAVMDVNRITQFFGAPPIRGTAQLEESYYKARAEGEGTWDAYGQAFEDWDAPGALKFAIEVGADPITYFGLGLYTGATRAVPVLGPLVKATERGWIAAWNLPFAGMKKAYQTAVPRTLDQIASGRARTWFDAFNDTFATRFARESGLVGADPEEMALLTREAIREYVTDPGRAGGKLWEFGQRTYQYLKRFIGPDEISDWSREVGGKTPLTRQMTQDINYIYESLQGSGIHGILKTSEAAPMVLRILGVDDTAEAVARMSRLLGGRLARDVDGIFSLFRGTANESLVRAGQRIESVFMQNAKSDVWRFSEQSGKAMSLGMARKADAILNWKGAQLLDQIAVRPMASMYLLFLNYGPFNWVETIFRAGRGGAGFIGNPRGNVVDDVMEMWGYLRLPHDLRFAGPRLEVAIAPGKGETIYGHVDYSKRAGKGLLPFVTREAPIANIPVINKVPRQLWSLQNWNDMWARVGQRQRAVYVHRKMLQKMADLAPDQMKLIGEATGDIHKAGLKSFSRDNLDEIGERVAAAGIHGPDSVTAMRTTPDAMMARKYRSDIATMFDKFPEIEAAYQNRIIRLADRGELPGNVDRIIEETFNAATDDYLSKLPARAEMLRRWARELTEGIPRPLTETGYRAGHLRVTRGVMASEGEGLYVGKTREFTEFFADERKFVEVSEVGYSKPRRILKVEGETTPILSESDVLFEPIKSTDPEWIRLNKQAIQNTGTTDKTWGKKTGGELQAELSRLVRQAGYDAADFGEWMVLYDETLWRGALTPEESIGLVRKLSDTRDVVDDVVEQHRKVATERGHEVNMEARDQIHTQAHTDMIDFFSALDDIDQLSILLKDRVAQLPDEKLKVILTDQVDNLVEQQRNMIATRIEERAIITDAKAAAPKGVVDWDELNPIREKLWNEKYWPRIRSLREEYDARAAMSPGAVPFGTIDQVVGDLAPAHVARLFSVTGDDLSRGLVHTETMTVMGRDRFVDKVRVRANVLARELGKTAEQLGFSDEAIARTYDQILAKIRMDPATVKTLEPLKQSFEGVRQRIHEITNLRALPEGEAEAFNTYLEGVAGKLQASEMFTQNQEGNWIATGEWARTREKAMDDVRTNFELDFTDYSHQNMFDAFMRRLMPFWTYESQRWPYLARAAVQTPGVFTGWGKYMDYSDTGYINVPGTDLQLNPFRGTVFMGGLRRFYLRDYPEYYDRFKPWAEFFDYAGRAGFYPGIHISLPISIWGGERMQIGEVLPAFVRSGLGVLVGAGVPGAQNLQEIIFPERFRNYEIGLIVSRMAQQRELDINGQDLWRKQQQGLSLDPDEQSLWDEATRHIGRLALMREQTGLFRIAPQERIMAWKEQAKVREALTGISTEMQETMRLREPTSGERFSDLFPLDPLAQEQLNELDAIKYWVGSISPLLPSEYQAVYARITQYYEETETIFESLRTTGYVDEESGRRWPSTKELHERFVAGEISAADYTHLIGESIGEAVGRASGLRESKYFADVPITMEERIAFAEEHNLPQPTFHPGRELIWEYYNLAPQLREDESGNLSYDYFTYFGQVDAILEAMPEPIKTRFLDYIHREWTPTQKLYWTVSKEYMQPYRNLREAVMEQYTPEQRAILRQYPRVTDLVERERLMAITLPNGDKLISTYNRELATARETLRYMSPDLDAWSAFWGRTTTFKTRQAKFKYIELMSTHRPGADLEVSEVDEFLGVPGEVTE